MAQADREKRWNDEIAALVARDEVEAAAGRSWRLLRAEATSLADALARHWQDPASDGAPSLAAVLPPDTGPELRALAVALGVAVDEYALAVDLADGEVVPCAEHVLGELIAALRFAGAASDELRTAAERLHHQRLRDPEGPAALATRLASSARLANAMREHLARLPGFDFGLIDDADTLVLELGAQAPRRVPCPAAARALARRDALATLLARRLGQVRRAAWFVFRNDREILRDFPSPYERPPL